ncbi:MAG TPA: c-type cytochrome [Agriterribacter sp.]|nr:c-type cytochrome [Agriterribacter sp.]
MKKIKKIVKWLVMVLLVLIVSLTITVMARQNLKYEAPYPEIRASTDSAVIARGKHLVYSSAHCIDCHNKANSDSLINLGLEVPLIGGVAFERPVGTIYSKNITPDKETGIGKYTDAEIARALRYGVHPDGTAVFDFMPFHNTSDEDLTAIISYLRAQIPVKHEIPGHVLNPVGKAVKAFMVKPVGPNGDVPKTVVPDTTAVYGKYLAVSVAECNGCHTKRNLAGAFEGEPFAGGNDIDGFITPNLTPDSSGRIFNWTKEMFIERFRMGKLIPKSPMPWNSFKRMTDDELTAIYNYLKTVEPVNTTAITGK